MAVTSWLGAGGILTAAIYNTSSIPIVSATSDIVSPVTNQIIYNSATGKLHKYSGSAWAVYNPSLLDASEAVVLTAESTTSTSFTDLATAGPAVTVTSAGTRALVVWSATMYSADGTTRGGYCDYAISSATTRAASDDTAICATANNTGSGYRFSGTDLVTINPGSNTFTLKYRSTGGSFVFQRRSLMVLAP